MEIIANIENADIVFENVSCLCTVLNMTDTDKQEFTFYISRNIAKKLCEDLDRMFNRDDGK